LKFFLWRKRTDPKKGIPLRGCGTPFSRCGTPFIFLTIACLEEAAQQDQAAVDSLKKPPNNAFDAMKNLSSGSLNMNDIIQNALLEPH